jgi:hypothetical protein
MILLIASSHAIRAQETPIAVNGIQINLEEADFPVIMFVSGPEALKPITQLPMEMLYSSYHKQVQKKRNSFTLRMKGHIDCFLYIAPSGKKYRFEMRRSSDFDGYDALTISRYLEPLPDQAKWGEFITQ